MGLTDPANGVCCIYHWCMNLCPDPYCLPTLQVVLAMIPHAGSGLPRSGSPEPVSRCNGLYELANCGSGIKGWCWGQGVRTIWCLGLSYA